MIAQTEQQNKALLLAGDFGTLDIILHKSEIIYGYTDVGDVIRFLIIRL